MGRVMTCPTSCDTDCHVPCHQSHQPYHKKRHAEEGCPGELNAVWVCLREDDDDIAYGICDSYEDALRCQGGFDDNYPARVDGTWARQRLAEIEARHTR